MYMLKIWPLQIDAAISDGQQAIDAQTEIFTVKLDSEKEEFTRKLEEYKDDFKQITKFHSYDTVGDFAKISNKLSMDLEKGAELVDEFNRREGLFKTKPSEWLALNEIAEQFKPFNELIDCAFNVKQNLSDWTSQPLS